MSTKQHIYLSPHFTDAVLSCGGQIARLTTTGATVIVATVFGGRPPAHDLSPLAAAVHARLDLGEDPVERRRQENRAALAALGAIGRSGDYLEALYRQDAAGKGWLYAREAALVGPVAPQERGLAYELAQDIAALAPAPAACTLYAPLAIGNHVDQQLLRRAGLILQDAGYAVCFYEDYPAVVRDKAGLERALNRSQCVHRQPQVIALDAACLQRKVQAIQACASQVVPLFGSLEGVGPAITALARQAAGGAGAGERVWRLSRAAPRVMEAPAPATDRHPQAMAGPAPVKATASGWRRMFRFDR